MSLATGTINSNRLFSPLFSSVFGDCGNFLLLDKDYSVLAWLGLAWLYGISTIVGYLMPNPLYTYILNI